MKTIRVLLSPINIKLILLSIFISLLLISRFYITKTFFYSFLVWNLFLAIVPYIISQLLLTFQFKINSWIFWLLFIVWLLFLPNSPYIITDLVHLHSARSTLLWGDLFLVFAFAFVGLLFGLSSMLNMVSLLRKKLTEKYVQLLMFLVCFASGFGIYIGRFLRFNSWDVLTNPLHLVKAVFFSSNTLALMITCAFGIFLWIAFHILESLKTESYK